MIEGICRDCKFYKDSNSLCYIDNKTVRVGPYDNCIKFKAREFRSQNEKPKLEIKAQQINHENILDKNVIDSPVDLKDEPISDWIITNFKDNIIFVMNKADKGEYYVYDGIIWQPDHKRKYQQFIIKAVKHLIEVLKVEAEVVEPKTDYDEIKKTDVITKEYAAKLKRIETAKKYLDYKNMQALWKLLQGKVATDNREFDTNYNLLNFRNGTFEIDTWTFREHRASDMLTKVMPVDYKLEAECLKFKLDLARSFSNRDEQNYVKIMFGHTLGRHPEKKTFHLTGPGDTGKTTLLNAIMLTLGDDGITGYAVGLGSDTFTASKAKQATRNDFLMAKNCCIIGIDEQKADERQDTSTIKAYTGGSKLNIRGIYESNQVMNPSAALFDTSNRLPRLDATDSGIVNRQVVISFTEIVKEKISEYWTVLYKEEASGILNFLLEGLTEYRTNGFPGLPKRFKEDTEKYIRDNNIIERFLSFSCITGDSNKCRLQYAIFHNGFKEYCRIYEGIDERYMPGKDKIIDQLKQKGVSLNERKTRIGKDTFYNVLMGIRFKTKEESYMEDLEVYRQDSQNMQWLHEDIKKFLEAKAEKETTLNELHTTFKTIPIEIIEQAVNQMMTAGTIIRTGPTEFGLPLMSDKR